MVTLVAGKLERQWLWEVCFQKETQGAAAQFIFYKHNTLKTLITSVLPTPYPVWLQTNWRDSGFALVLETNCKRKPKGQLPSLFYNHNIANPQNICEGVVTNAFQSCSKELLVTTCTHTILLLGDKIKIHWCDGNNYT